jgi:hypothetical protein
LVCILHWHDRPKAVRVKPCHHSFDAGLREMEEVAASALAMVPPPHCDTDQSRIVYLVRLISTHRIWYCKWFMLFMTLDMPDEGTR